MSLMLPSKFLRLGQDDQKFQVPKMEGFLNILLGYSLLHTHTAYIGEDEPSILGTNPMCGDRILGIVLASSIESYHYLGDGLPG